jgi:uncharacterized protein (TIGR00369 family)
MLFNPAQENFKENVMAKIKANTFTNYIGFEMIELEAGKAMGRLPVKPDFYQQLQFLHGGLTATVADIVMGFAAFTLVQKDQHVVTAQLQTSYLNPVVSDFLYAKGYVIKAGQRLYFCEAELWTEKNDKTILVAKASSTMAVVEPILKAE